MDLGDIIGAIVAIIIVCVVGVFLIALSIVVFVLAMYSATYTVALFHILFIEPAIFDTHSLFTIPYNEIASMANMHSIFVWIMAAVYIVGGLEVFSGKKGK